jgi:hypothetical protein
MKNKTKIFYEIGIDEAGEKSAGRFLQDLACSFVNTWSKRTTRCTAPVRRGSAYYHVT